MNQQAYRVIYSKVSNTYIAVAENTLAQGNSAGHTSSTHIIGYASRNRYAPLTRYATLGMLVAALFGNVTFTQAQMVAYKNGSRPAPIIDRAGNGVPLVHINPPNAAGVSHNQYEQFNMDSSGAILNNVKAGSVAVNTQLGGYVQANLQLLNSAKVILNEVVSANRSNLHGYVEVAGPRADVIVANPNGISVNGFGVINGGNVTLTTGVPQFGGEGSLAAYRVTKGEIAINGNGLNTQGNDSLKLYARSVAANAKVWANQLQITTGTNQINDGDGTVQIIAGEGGVPTVGLDVAAIGGLYAGKIFLVGTEQGLGVKTLGDIAASAGDVVIDSTGKVILKSKLNASANVDIRSAEDIDNAGTIYAQNTHINGAATVTNSGTIAAQYNLNTKAATIHSSGVLASGIDANGIANQAGDLTLNTEGSLTATGSNTAGRNIVMNGAHLNLANAHTSANGQVDLNASVGDINHSGANLQVLGATTLKK